MKSLLLSIGSVVAGFLTVVVLSILTDTALEAVGVLPQPGQPLTDFWLLLLALVYRTAYTVLGGWVTAKLAPRRSSLHVLILAVLGTLGGIGGIVAGMSMDLSPLWYPVALAVLAFPSVWWGGRLAPGKP